MLEVFKIINGFTDIGSKRIFELIHTRPGRHNKSVVRHHSRLDARHEFFSQRVINTLPSDCVNALRVNKAIYEPAGSLPQTLSRYDSMYDRKRSFCQTMSELRQSFVSVFMYSNRCEWFC